MFPASLHWAKTHKEFIGDRQVAKDQEVDDQRDGWTLLKKVSEEVSK